MTDAKGDLPSDDGMPVPAQTGGLTTALPPRPKADSLDAFFLSDTEHQGAMQTYLGDLKATAARHVVEYLGFWVADEEYAVEIVEIQEIIKLPLITEVPRVHASVLGIISLRGTIVPVLDLRVVLGLSRDPLTRASRILVLRASGDPIGLLVDRVTSVARLERDAIEAAPQALRRETEELIEGVGRVEGRMVIVLDADAIMALMDDAS